MELDALTFMVAGAFATGFAGICILVAWFQLGRPPAMSWWGLAYVLSSIGLASITTGLATGTIPLVMAGDGILTLVPAMIWAGARVFNDRLVFWPLFGFGSVAWLMVLLAPVDLDVHLWSAFLEFVASAVYLPLAAIELWSTRKSERLAARPYLVALLLLHASIFLGGCYEVLSGNFSPGETIPLYSWFGLIHIESLAFAAGGALLMILLCKERLDTRRLDVANLDALTGAVNRSTLFQGAERLLEASRKGGTDLSLIMFDLDHFKAINDNFGHQAGDRILTSFARTVHANLRSEDVFGRYGGEEFMVLLPGASVEEACFVAERIREAFEDEHRLFEGALLNATVSAGVGVASFEDRLQDIISSVDRATYRAKSKGRNRVERAELVGAAERKVIGIT